MQIRFLGQPFEDALGHLEDILSDALGGDAYQHLHIATAWAKRSGLTALRASLTKFREHGGRSQLIVGIDHAGATRQGLEMACELFDSVHVFHDPARRTFHPKVYFLAGDRFACLIVGSNNATHGGIAGNYEAALIVHLDAAAPEDVELAQAISRWFELLYAENAICLELTPELLARLVADTRYKIADEDAASLQRGGDGPGDASATEDAPRSSLFGRRLGRVRRGTTPRRRRQPEARGRRRDAERSEDHPVLRWSKRLAKSDAYQPRARSNPTANLRLVQGDYPEIDRTTFFRRDLFGKGVWSASTDRNGNPKEVATIPFDVVLDGVPLGVIDLEVTHAPHREAGQHNHLSALSWRGRMASLMRATDYTGAWVIIERMDDDSFRLEISRVEPSRLET